MQPNLLGLWHFDESDGPVALNSVKGGRPMNVYSARREPRRFGSALVMQSPHAFAAGPAPGKLAEGAICFWLRVTGGATTLDILDIQGNFSIIVDNASDGHLMAVLGETIFKSEKPIDQDRWVHIGFVFSYDGSRLFVDGRLVHEDRQANGGLEAGAVNTFRTRLGPIREPGTSISIDELAIYNRALADQEVVQLMLSGLEITDPVRTPPPPREVHTSQYIDPADPTFGLQTAVDALGPSGGTVIVTPGRYLLRQSVRLPSNVTLKGQSPQSVISMPQPEGTRLMLSVATGAEGVEVEDPSAFAAGDQIIIVGPQQRGYDVTQAVVREVQGRMLWLSRALAQDYVAKEGVMVFRWHPAVTAICQQDVTIENLVIDADVKPVSSQFNPTEFNCSAIHLIDCVDSKIIGCRVVGWPHDGISAQGGRNITVNNCVVRSVAGHGLHPGTSLRYSKWTNNVATNCGGDGLFVCAEVEHAVITGNLLERNGRHGIGGLGNGDDRFNTVMGNHCILNAQAGIAINGASANMIANNVCRDNSQNAPGKWGGIVLQDTNENLVTGNMLISDDANPSQTIAIEERDGCSDNQFANNLCQGCKNKLADDADKPDNKPVVPKPRKSRLGRFPDLDAF